MSARLRWSFYLCQLRPGVLHKGNDADSARVALKRVRKAHQESDCCAGNEDGDIAIVVGIRRQHVALNLVAKSGVPVFRDQELNLLECMQEVVSYDIIHTDKAYPATATMR